MANSIEYLESLPDIDLLGDEGITLEGIMQEMREDYEAAYEEATGEECILYPANPYRLLMNVIAGEIYQAYHFSQEMFKKNFIRYMDDDLLANWGANLGYTLPAAKSAVVDLEFGLNDALDFDVPVPAATRATAGDDVYFATDREAVIRAGELSVIVSASCVEAGSLGNQYEPGQLSTIVDLIPYVSWVTNSSRSSGGYDSPSGDDLKEEVFLFPSTYSTAGPEDAYIALVKGYSSEIADVTTVTDNATVNIFILLTDGRLPEPSYLANVKEYLEELKQTPDTDCIVLHAPEVVEYVVNAAYYIAAGNKDNEGTIKANVEEAAEYYTEQQCSGIGIDIDSGSLVELAKVAGAKRIVVDAPSYVKLSKSQVAVCKRLNLEYGGLEE